ncbi:CG9121 [Drosophila busckii]|uniref:CG9121 n=1 Tax=Drosophila busckii TaxID=30019 RepID=A0A0M4EP14_DROBS|nr:CG9121 [Drosophila busckii]
MLSYDLNERLMTAVHSGDFADALNCIIEGAQATYVSSTCGRTAVGTAALLGDAEILQLLIQSCEEPQLNRFHQGAHTDSMETDSTPDGMEKLEWVDEFEGAECDEHSDEHSAEDDGGLYHYYAKTFENTGAFLTECCVRCRHQDPHLYDTELTTPLHYAAAWGHDKCVAILLKHQAPINVVNSEGYTPLHVGAGFVEVTRLLIKHGALINAKTLSDGKTALHLAIENRAPDSAQLLLENNVNVNDTDDEGGTPLMLAIVCDLHPLSFELLERGARINLQDKHGYTALYYAVTGRHVKLAKLLLERGARRLPGHHLLHHCISAHPDDRELVSLLLQHGESLSVRDRDNLTPIMLAIHQQLPELLSFLLDQAEQQRRLGLYNAAQDEGLLLFAVQQIEDVRIFRRVLRVLLAKLPSARLELYGSQASTLFCGFTYSATPLARAISLQRLDIAQLLLREGAHLGQLQVQLMHDLCTNGQPQLLAFAELLVNAGLKFPPPSEPPGPLEQQLRQLSTVPRTLQSLSRQVIRQRLLEQLQQPQSMLHVNYAATEQSSALARIVDAQLCVPNTLKIYLSKFSDLPQMRGTQHNGQMINAPESWD